MFIILLVKFSLVLLYGSGVVDSRVSSESNRALGWRLNLISLTIECL